MVLKGLNELEMILFMNKWSKPDVYRYFYCFKIMKQHK